MALSQDFAEEDFAEESLTEEGLAEEDSAGEDSAEKDSAGEAASEEGVRCVAPLPVVSAITSAFMTGPCSVRFQRTSPF